MLSYWAQSPFQIVSREPCFGGVPPSIPTWGLMAAEGRQYLDSAWWVTFFPCMAIMAVVLALNYIGDWLRDSLDPRLRQL